MKKENTLNKKSKNWYKENSIELLLANLLPLVIVTPLVTFFSFKSSKNLIVTFLGSFLGMFLALFSSKLYMTYMASRKGKIDG